MTAGPAWQTFHNLAVLRMLALYEDVAALLLLNTYGGCSTRRALAVRAHTAAHAR